MVPEEIRGRLNKTIRKNQGTWLALTLVVILFSIEPINILKDAYSQLQELEPMACHCYQPMAYQLLSNSKGDLSLSF